MTRLYSETIRSAEKMATSSRYLILLEILTMSLVLAMRSHVQLPKPLPTLHRRDRLCQQFKAKMAVDQMLLPKRESRLASQHGDTSVLWFIQIQTLVSDWV